MIEIDDLQPWSGRGLKEDNTTANLADIIDSVFDPVTSGLKMSSNLDAFGRLRVSNPMTNSLYFSMKKWSVAHQAPTYPMKVQ